MATATTDSVCESIRAYLAANLNTELTSQSLPNIVTFHYGPVKIPPTVVPPQLWVDISDWRQERIDLNKRIERRETVEVTACYDVVSDATNAVGEDGVYDYEQVTLDTHKLSAAIVKVLEGDRDMGGTGTWLQVDTCDFSPPIIRAHALACFCLLRLTVWYDREEGT